MGKEVPVAEVVLSHDFSTETLSQVLGRKNRGVDAWDRGPAFDKAPSSA